MFNNNEIKYNLYYRSRIKLNNIIKSNIVEINIHTKIRLIVELDYDIISLVRPDVKIGSRQFFEIKSLKVV